MSARLRKDIPTAKIILVSNSVDILLGYRTELVSKIGLFY